MATTDAERTLHDRVETWLAAQMPIIRMHGGESAVRTADPATGEVVIELGGACAGCGISTRTAQTIKLELAREFDEVTDVTVRTGDGGTTDWDIDQPESFMGIDRTEGGRGDPIETGPDDSEQHF